MSLIQMNEFESIKKPLDVGYNKTCNCKSCNTNCMTPKEWMKSQVALWEFYYEKRDIRDKNVHPASFPISLPKQCIKLFTHEGELVLDPFAGIGSSLIAAQDLNRNAVGFDLKKEYVDIANSRLTQQRLNPSTKQIAINDESHNIPNYFNEGTISLVVTSPPYANMLNTPRKNKSMRANLRNNEHFNHVLQYSNDPRDLGLLMPKEYAKKLAEIYKGILPLMREKAHSIINVNDLWLENKRYPTHAYVIEELEKVGYELRNIIIWDKRNLVNGVGIFGYPNNFITLTITFEYMLDFWKPPK